MSNQKKETKHQLQLQSCNTYANITAKSVIHEHLYTANTTLIHKKLSKFKNDVHKYDDLIHCMKTLLTRYSLINGISLSNQAGSYMEFKYVKPKINMVDPLTVTEYYTNNRYIKYDINDNTCQTDRKVYIEHYEEYLSGKICKIHKTQKCLLYSKLIQYKHIMMFYTFYHKFNPHDMILKHILSYLRFPDINKYLQRCALYTNLLIDTVIVKCVDLKLKHDTIKDVFSIHAVFCKLYYDLGDFSLKE